jgi:hypothetical protein
MEQAAAVATQAIVEAAAAQARVERRERVATEEEQVR